MKILLVLLLLLGPAVRSSAQTYGAFGQPYHVYRYDPVYSTYCGPHLYGYGVYSPGYTYTYERRYGVSTHIDTYYGPVYTPSPILDGYPRW